MPSNDGLWFWERYARIYDLMLNRDRRAYDRVGRLICGEIGPESDLLELAAGTGLIAQRVGGHCRSYLATDYSEKMLSGARRKKWPASVSFAWADATNLLYPDGSFDAVIISNALHIMPDPAAALKNIRRVLREGGRLIAPTFVRYGTKKESLLDKPMRRFGFRSFSNWSPTEYFAFLEQNGWRVVKSEIIPAGFDIAFAVAE